MREENIFFDKKLEILKEGFAQLDADRRALNREKKAFIAEKNARLKEKSFREKSITGDVADNIFLLLIRKMESGSLMLLWKRNLVYNCINAVIYNNYEKYSFSGD